MTEYSRRFDLRDGLFQEKSIAFSTRLLNKVTLLLLTVSFWAAFFSPLQFSIERAVENGRQHRVEFRGGIGLELF